MTSRRTRNRSLTFFAALRIAGLAELRETIRASLVAVDRRNREYAGRLDLLSRPGR